MQIENSPEVDTSPQPVVEISKEEKVIFEIENQLILPQLLDELMTRHQIDLVGIRGTCSVAQPVSLELDEGNISLLTPSEILANGHERRDRDVFQVTQYRKNSKVHERTTSWSKAATGNIKNILSENNTSVPVFQTYIIYHPNYIYTTERTNPFREPGQSFLNDIPDNYIRASMKTDNPSKAIIAIVVIKPH